MYRTCYSNKSKRNIDNNVPKAQTLLLCFFFWFGNIFICISVYILVSSFWVYFHLWKKCVYCCIFNKKLYFLKNKVPRSNSLHSSSISSFFLSFCWRIYLIITRCYTTNIIIIVNIRVIMISNGIQNWYRA